ncbi:N-acetyltransferase [Streptomyces spiroverticillatus]|uniref:N-acetyltransferase n=1 Tax=Streptomyces finlayi TaxID=67296 RepID=A0A918WS16_9ACTN|nr:GNAT family N-acetyltransferase [Streptomyces finlayi]GGZ85259.1 N-acetyltransferase [Streptomyces spiroverticillatus]GHC76918.1 N-acetyltransferase [Streptomyces finlayi]
MDMRIRTAEPAEHTAVGEITARAYLDDGLLSGGAQDTYLPVLRDAASRAEKAELLVAVDADGTLLGTVTYAPQGSPLQDIAVPGEAEFRMLAVAHAARGRGAGEALVRACIARARAEEGVVRLVMSTQPTMLGAHRIYERLGFVRTPDRDWEPLPGLGLLTYELGL